MPVASQINTAAVWFRQNRVELDRSLKGLTPEDWLKRPNQTSNHVMWIVGHIVWARSRALFFLGQPEWSLPWFSSFVRGSKIVDADQYPSPAEVVAALDHVTGLLTTALENATEEALAAPAGPKSPSFDGTIGGMIDFLAFHEAGHVGQVSYLRCWLGHGGAVR